MYDTSSVFDEQKTSHNTRGYMVGAIEISYISIHLFRQPHLSYTYILLRTFQDEMLGLQANRVHE